MSASTRRGWWKAPTRFLPSGELIPVLPPTELSTWASSVVGICTKPTPRRRMAAAKPARSPITPPPKAITRSSRATFSAISHSTACSSAPQPLVFSPGGSASVTAATPAASSPASSAARCCAATRASVRIATRGRAKSGAIAAPARATSPAPMRTS